MHLPSLRPLSQAGIASLSACLTVTSVGSTTYEVGNEDASFPARSLRSIRPATHIALCPSAKYCADYINTRLASCNSLHRGCHTLTKPQLPTRVIDVGNEATLPRLFESDGKRANYIALSHCWGNSEHQPLQTTTQNLLHHYKKMSWTALCQTFQDAILITRELELQFLWIDSLCIVQDSHSDWETESSRMAEVYRNSLVTLAATASLDGSGGCLFARSSMAVVLDNTETGLSTGEKIRQRTVIPELTDVFVRRPVQHAHDAILLKRGGANTGAPLLNRAWVYQETALSPRTLHFHSEELIWECREGISCECGYEKFPEVPEEIYSMGYYDPGGWKSPFSRLERLRNEGTDSHERLLSEWYCIVNVYSGLRLTHDRDRLPALAGLASRFAKKLNTPYLAGLWLSDLWKGLLWKRNPSITCRRLSGSKATIPTWSWASLIPTHDATTAPSIEYPPHHLPTVDSRFTILSAECPMLGMNAFGQVNGGLLQVKGALAKIPPLQNQSKLRGFESNKYSLVFDIFNPKGTLEEVVPEDTLYCLIVGYRKHQKGRATQSGETFCLVLKRVQGRMYRRVGFLSQEDDDTNWLQGAEVADIEIM